jgi:hypothetical protein
MCARFVPHLLMLDQKYQRVASSVEFVEMIGDDRNVLKRTVMGDKSWCFMYNPEICNLVEPKETKSSELRMQKMQVKTMLNAFFYVKGIIHREFELEKQTVNSKFYKEVINRLIA